MLLPDCPKVHTGPPGAGGGKTAVVFMCVDGVHPATLFSYAGASVVC